MMLVVEGGRGRPNSNHDRPVHTQSAPTGSDLNGPTRRYWLPLNLTHAPLSSTASLSSPSADDEWTAAGTVAERLGGVHGRVSADTI